jgi:hypothetical protein
MLTADTFCMTDAVGRARLGEHPAWAAYRGAQDRGEILAWGVPEDRLDAELEKYEYCGTGISYPVLAPDPLPERPGLVLAARFTTGTGNEIDGYVVDARVFGLFLDGRELCFNRTLPGRAEGEAERLAACLGVTAEALFPLRYRTGLRDASGREVAGELEAFWRAEV